MLRASSLTLSLASRNEVLAVAVELERVEVLRGYATRSLLVTDRRNMIEGPRGKGKE
jgi:hypothetical protein